MLERRERLGGACTLERPFDDDRFVVSPCAYVVGLLDELVIDELDLRERGLRFLVADPNLWVPFEDGTSFGQWLDDARTQPSLEALGLSEADIDGYWAYEELFDEVRKLRKGERDTWVGDTPTRAEIEEILGRRPGDDRPRLRGLDRRRPRRLHRRRAAQDGALRPGRSSAPGAGRASPAPPRSS